MQSQQQFKQLFSFEFFPAKTEQGVVNLLAVQQKLAQLDPHFFSVTSGAGGSTQDNTVETVLKIAQNNISAAPHMSCIASSRKTIKELLDHYKEHDINRIVALRGDMPSGMMSMGELRYANELVEFIRQQSGDHFDINVAAYPEVHPQARNSEEDLVNFKRKVDAGANAAITQYFYNIDAYFYFIDACEKKAINIPIIPGIMPITNYTQLFRFSEMCGADIPRWMRKRLESFGDDIQSIQAFGIDVVSGLCQRLLDSGAPGIHFYTMNRAEPTLAIWENIKSK